MVGKHQLKKRNQYAKVSDANFSDNEIAFLEIARLFFLSFSTPNTHAWEHAIHHGKLRYGECKGQLFALGVLEVINEMRRSRKHIFKFSNPTCPCCINKLSDHERLLMDIISLRRTQNHTAANISALILCEGNCPKKLYIATDKFWNEFNHYDSAQKIALIHNNII